MSGRLIGKIALITGGGGGIGRATAKAFVREGAKVAVVDVDGDAARGVASELVAAGGDAIAIRTDVSHADEVAAMVAQVAGHFGRLDIAFNNAGIDLEHEPLAMATEETFDRLMNVNVKGTFLCMKEFHLATPSAEASNTRRAVLDDVRSGGRRRRASRPVCCLHEGGFD
jgi:NAD(P)-dependent dehydrogenase (short-subunit alcohol dehydrogenase family)